MSKDKKEGNKKKSIKSILKKLKNETN